MFSAGVEAEFAVLAVLDQVVESVDDLLVVHGADSWLVDETARLRGRASLASAVPAAWRCGIGII
ncbi:hypothetical protein D3C86_1743900 [compost metagenome]